MQRAQQRHQRRRRAQFDRGPSGLNHPGQHGQRQFVMDNCLADIQNVADTPCSADISRDHARLIATRYADENDVLRQSLGLCTSAAMTRV